MNILLLQKSISDIEILSLKRGFFSDFTRTFKINIMEFVINTALSNYHHSNRYFGNSHSSSQYNQINQELVVRICTENLMKKTSYNYLCRRRAFLLKGIVGLDLRWKYDVKLFLAKTLPSARLASQMPVFWQEKAWQYIFISNLSLLCLWWKNV